MSLTESQEPNTEKLQPLIFGIDIGGTKMEIAIFDQSLNFIDSWRVSTPTENYEHFLSSLISLINDATEKYGSNYVLGVGMPGIISDKGKVKSANVSCATGKYIAKDIERIIDSKVSIGNDCRLFALSESIGGAGTGYKNVYGAIIGTGAAGGLCIEGQLYSGRNGIAGEYGHIPVSAYLIEKYNLPVFKCGCGLTGCYEPYISGPGLGRLYKHFGAQNSSTYDFVKNLKQNDKIAKQTFSCYMSLLGASFASLILSYDPDVIVVGGGISKIDEIIDALPDAIEDNLFEGVFCPPIKHAKFGDSSGVRGAAILRISCQLHKE
ncbi:ROK family protein [Parashewanella tropica]|uniref:ROK family protein n=1 Tax=Parashewanella tropica TaxID=2547970 RepID=UPI00105A3F97|nr:ROK family protein [Parashewanella tropica]